MKISNNMAKKKEIIIGASLIFLEITLILALFSFLPSITTAIVGENNVTVITNLTVGNTYPEVIAIQLNGGSSISLTPNATTLVSCIGVLRDYNGEGDINFTNATLYDSVASSSGDTDDNNYHYTNSSCEITADAGTILSHDTDDPDYALANCTFQVEYYANAQTWTCNMTVNDSIGWEGQNYTQQSINQLLALGLPDIIQYGTVNATEVSAENITNVTNYGNTQINLTLEGYAQTQGDGYAMNCTKGNVGFINITYEKYNLTTSNPGTLSLSAFEAVYENLTSAAVTKQFELASRTNDTVNDAINQSYWRIYVPIGVAGTCQGNIIFGATTAAAT